MTTTAWGLESTAPIDTDIPRRPLIDRIRPWGIVSLFTYCGIGLFANWPSFPADSTRIRAGDLSQMVWYLAWTPFALVHHMNVFVSNWLAYPHGVNLAENTSSPLLGLIAWPVTAALNPLASLNLLLWLVFPASGMAMYVSLRRMKLSGPSAFVGGLFYSASPYVITQSLDHLDLAFVPLPPLIGLATYEIMRSPGKYRVRWGVCLGCCVVGQFLISAEIAASCVIMAGVGAIAAVLTWRGIALRAILASWKGLLIALCISGAVLWYPVLEMVAGPYRYRSPAYPGGVNADLLSPFVPTVFEKIAPGASIGNSLVSGNISENSGYVGIPLVILAGVLLVRTRSKVLRWSIVMAAIATVLSFGPHLVVDNHALAVPLPFDAIASLPIVNNIIASRLSLYVDLFLAFAVAVAMEEFVLAPKRQVPHPLPALVPRGSHSLITRVMVGLLVVLAAVAFVPRWPFVTSTAGIPPAFTDHRFLDHIRPGSVVLMTPYPSVAEVEPQVWQATAGMRFRMVGGYILTGGATGGSTNYPSVLKPVAVEQYLWAKSTGGTAYPSGRTPVLSARLVCDAREFVRRNHVADVVAVTGDADPQTIASLFNRAFGRPDVVGAGAKMWTVNVHDRAARCG